LTFAHPGPSFGRGGGDDEVEVMVDCADSLEVDMLVVRVAELCDVVVGVSSTPVLVPVVDCAGRVGLSVDTVVATVVGWTVVAGSSVVVGSKVGSMLSVVGSAVDVATTTGGVVSRIVVVISLVVVALLSVVKARSSSSFTRT
jgi:hypothetical protein